MRRILVVLHRWFGLATAVFLFVAGATGAVISWDHELDAWLNPALYEARTAVAPPSAPPALEIADRLERDEPRLRVRYLPLAPEPGHTLLVFVEPRIDPATGEPFDLGYNQLAIDPADGGIQARRSWGDVSLSRENLLPFLYKLHYSLHIPDGFGLELGVLFFGIVAIVWAIDTLIALWISFPSARTWRRSFRLRLRSGGARLNFDLHRSGGVWAFPLLLVVAVTAVSMNLHREVMRPLVGLFSPLSPSPFDTRTAAPPNLPVEPLVGRAAVVARAREDAARRGLEHPPGGVFYSAAYGVYGVGLFEPGNDHGDGGLGNAWLYFDGADGAPAGALVPGEGSAGDVFLQAQFPLHSGRILGTPGRALMSVLGAVVAMLSVTGVVIWARRLRTQSRQALHRSAAGEAGSPVAAGLPPREEVGS